MNLRLAISYRLLLLYFNCSSASVYHQLISHGHTWKCWSMNMYTCACMSCDLICFQYWSLRDEYVNDKQLSIFMHARTQPMAGWVDPYSEPCTCIYAYTVTHTCTHTCTHTHTYTHIHTHTHTHTHTNTSFRCSSHLKSSYSLIQIQLFRHCIIIVYCSNSWDLN